MPRYDDARLINETTGDEIPQDMRVHDFRGDPTTFLYVSRLPEGSSSGRIVITDARGEREVFPGVIHGRIETA